MIDIELLKQAFISGQEYGANRTDNNFNDFLEKHNEAINYTQCCETFYCDSKVCSDSKGNFCNGWCKGVNEQEPK
tara:strand:- start:158 stop:382 length:225 start_codon:yes stop_codon:yes gene_type:complete